MAASTEGIGLPLEILLLIAECLPPEDQLSLIKCYPGLASLFGPRHLSAHNNHKDNILHLLAKAGSEVAWPVRNLLTSKMTMNLCPRNKDCMTPLMYAAHYGSELIAKLLLERDATGINPRGSGDRNALLFAVKNNHAEVVKALLAQPRLDVNFPDGWTNTPLYIAVRKRFNSIARLLLARPDTDINKPGWNGLTPLMMACQDGAEDMVRMMIERGDLDINAQCEYDQSALIYAIRWGHYSIVKLLLAQQGIAVGAANHHSALVCAVQCGESEMAELLLARSDVSVDGVDIGGRLPLWYAVRANLVGIVKVLLKHGARADLADECGFTPISIARRKARENGWGDVMVKILEESLQDRTRDSEM